MEGIHSLNPHFLCSEVAIKKLLLEILQYTQEILNRKLQDRKFQHRLFSCDIFLWFLSLAALESEEYVGNDYFILLLINATKEILLEYSIQFAENPDKLHFPTTTRGILQRSARNFCWKSEDSSLSKTEVRSFFLPQL